MTTTGKLTPRERALCAHLAVVRYLTREQIWRLTFPGCWESVVSSRLHVLESLGLLRRKRRDGSPLNFRALDGRIIDAWTLTADGYEIAGTVLSTLPQVPAQDVGAQFLEHTTGLIELYLSMVGAGPERLGPKNRRGIKSATGPIRARNPVSAPLPLRWRWFPGEFLRLPMAHARQQSRGEPARVLQPDAVIEFPGQALRYFVEWETGTNPIRSEKNTSLLSKFDRYEEFFRNYESVDQRRTWYTSAYPDRWTARVLVVVHSEQRRENAAAALREWCAKDGIRNEWNPFRIMTVPEAQRALVSATGRAVEDVPAPSPRFGRPLDASEEQLRPGRVSVRGEQLIALVKQLSEFQRATAEAQRTGSPALPFPKELDRLLTVFRIYATRGEAALKAHQLHRAV